MVLDNYTEMVDEIADQIELMSDNDNKVKCYKDIMRIKFKTNDDLVFNEMMNIPICVLLKKMMDITHKLHYTIVFMKKMFLQKIFNLLLVCSSFFASLCLKFKLFLIK